MSSLAVSDHQSDLIEHQLQRLHAEHLLRLVQRRIQRRAKRDCGFRTWWTQLVLF